MAAPLQAAQLVIIIIIISLSCKNGSHDKIQSGADLNGDNLRICRAYLRMSDHCSVTIRVRVRVADCIYQLLEKVTLKCGSIT